MGGARQGPERAQRAPWCAAERATGRAGLVDSESDARVRDGTQGAVHAVLSRSRARLAAAAQSARTDPLSPVAQIRSCTVRADSDKRAGVGDAFRDCASGRLRGERTCPSLAASPAGLALRKRAEPAAVSHQALRSVITNRTDGSPRRNIHSPVCGALGPAKAPAGLPPGFVSLVLCVRFVAVHSSRCPPCLPLSFASSFSPSVRSPSLTLPVARRPTIPYRSAARPICAPSPRDRRADRPPAASSPRATTTPTLATRSTRAACRSPARGRPTRRRVAFRRT